MTTQPKTTNNVRKLIVIEFYSLDGLMSGPDDNVDWITASFSPDLGKYVDSIYNHCDTLLLGKVTYQIMAKYWPIAQTNPDAFEGDAEMADTMNNICKIVFSKSLGKPTWSNSEVTKEIIPSEITKMKTNPGKNILVAGSASIVQQLTNLGLVDQYHILLHPIILGTGTALFKNIKEKQNLKLIESKTFENGVVLLHYQPSTAVK